MVVIMKPSGSHHVTVCVSEESGGRVGEASVGDGGGWGGGQGHFYQQPLEHMKT